MQHDTEAMWQGRGWPIRVASGAERQTRGRRPRVSTRVHANARAACHVAGGVGIWRAHGLVGPGKMSGAVTQ